MKKVLWLVLFSIFFGSHSYAFWDENTFIWAKDAVNQWKDKEIISGYEDGSFRGKNHITRAELLSIVNKINGTNDVAQKRPANDVAEGLWYTNAVALGLQHEIISLDEAGNFRPYEYATREETMVIFSNLFHLKYEKDAYAYLVTNFSDANQISAENMSKVAGVIEFGFVTGYPDGTLRPKAYVTRTELIAMLNNCIEDIYGKGTYKNLISAKSIIINEGDVNLYNFEVKNKIFVMDGALDKSPYIVNTNVGMGINSRIGDIEIKRDDYWDTLAEKDEIKEEKEYAQPLIATIKYSDTTWTNEDVTVTLKIDNDDYQIVNNGGKNKYTFKTNGEFVFLCKDAKGKISRFLTEVDFIDRISPQLVASVTKTGTDAIVNLTVSDDGLSPIEEMAYAEGKITASAALRGIKIINNTFNVTKNGIYTIAVEDKAGNRSRIYINITGLAEPPTQNIPTQDTSTPDIPAQDNITPDISTLDNTTSDIPTQDIPTQDTHVQDTEVSGS